MKHLRSCFHSYGVFTKKIRHCQLLGLCVILLVSCQSAWVGPPPERSLKEPVWAERTSKGYVLHNVRGGRWQVFQGSAPDQIDWSQAPFMLEDSTGSVAVQAPRRLYFGMVHESGDTLILSERQLPFEGQPNFRDLGGIPTRDGRAVKWGWLYRSGALDGLEKQDLVYLNHLGIRTVVDFRMDEEIEEEPDRLPEGFDGEVLHAEIGLDAMAVDRQAMMDTLKKMQPEESALLLVEANKLFASKAAEDYQPFIDRLFEPEAVPMVFHCTAGKDRAGMGAVLVLSALGVDRQTIMDDYLMSNYYNQDRVGGRLNKVWLVGIDKEVIAPLMIVKREYLEAAFETIDSLHGSMDAFLENQYGLNDSLRQLLVDRYTYR